MKVYTAGDQTELLSVKCNSCGRQLFVENGILKEGCFHADNKFGYFSTIDNEVHSFDLCEECYRKIVSKFKIPVEIQDGKEFM